MLNEVLAAVGCTSANSFEHVSISLREISLMLRVNRVSAVSGSSRREFSISIADGVSISKELPMFVNKVVVAVIATGVGGLLVVGSVASVARELLELKVAAARVFVWATDVVDLPVVDAVVSTSKTVAVTDAPTPFTALTLAFALMQDVPVSLVIFGIKLNKSLARFMPFSMLA